MLRLRLPAGLQAALPAAAQRPLQLLLERFLAQPAAAADPFSGASGTSARFTTIPESCWLGAVVGAFVVAVVLRRPAGPEQAAAERHLTAALACLQRAAAVHGLLLAEAQRAAASAALDLRGWRSNGMGHGQALPACEQHQLLEEALRYLTCSQGLQLAAAAQLLTRQAEERGVQEAEQQAGPAAAMAAGVDVPQLAELHGTDLASLLHKPPTALELDLLCLVALLPCWEAVMQRLANLGAPGKAAGSRSHDAATSAAAAHAVQLLCSACTERPDDVLAQHPALLAEVCRGSFHLTCAYAAVLVRHQQAAAEGTRAAAQAARWRVAHAVKHPDHVSSYMLAKGCIL